MSHPVDGATAPPPDGARASQDSPAPGYLSSHMRARYANPDGTFDTVLPSPGGQFSNAGPAGPYDETYAYSDVEWGAAAGLPHHGAGQGLQPPPAYVHAEAGTPQPPAPTH